MSNQACFLYNIRYFLRTIIQLWFGYYDPLDFSIARFATRAIALFLGKLRQLRRLRFPVVIIIVSGLLFWQDSTKTHKCDLIVLYLLQSNRHISITYYMG